MFLLWNFALHTHTYTHFDWLKFSLDHALIYVRTLRVDDNSRITFFFFFSLIFSSVVRVHSLHLTISIWKHMHGFSCDENVMQDNLAGVIFVYSWHGMVYELVCIMYVPG